jgi:SAM-dependent methyltransferase
VTDASDAARGAARAEESETRVRPASREACRVCDNVSGNRLHTAREMFAGTRETFVYVECAACGTLQLRDVPDLRRYYAGGYYSFRPGTDAEGAQSASPAGRIRRGLGDFARRSAAAYYCARREPFGALRHPLGWLASRAAARAARDFPAYLRDATLDLRIDQNSAVLDVGSGAGATLLLLRRFGFRDLTGVDPFLDADITYENGVRVLKAEPRALERRFDLILANHSVEHVAAPRATLAEINRLLKADTYAVVRTPVVARAWETYGANWVQLDPPRHLFLFTAETFAALAAGAGFAVEEVRFDSTAFQFWGSEQYARDIPLTDPRSLLVDPASTIFPPEEIAAWEIEARRLNARAEGDQAIFYLRKK